VHSWAPEEGDDAIYNHLAWRPENKNEEREEFFTVDTNGIITRYNVNKGEKEEYKFEESANDCLAAIDFNLTGDKFVTVGTERKVRFYDTETMKIQFESDSFHTDFPGHNNRIFAAKFSKNDPNLVATGGWDQTIIFHDLRK